MPRDLRIAVADYYKSQLDSLVAILNGDRDSKHLADLDVHFSPYLTKNRESSQIVHDLRGYDMVLLGHHLRNFSGADIGSKIKSAKPRMPIIGINVRNPYTKMRDDSWSREAFDDQWACPDNKIMEGIEDLEGKIRSFAWKPLRTGIIGLGAFGYGLLQHFLGSDDVESVKTYSESGIHKKLPIEDNRKIVAVDSMEEIFKDTDVVAVTSSVFRKDKSYDISKREGREALLAYEAERFVECCKCSVRVGFEGLHVVFTNPVEPLCEIGRRCGIDPNKITFPVNIDARRIMSYGGFDNFYSDKDFSSLLSLMKERLVVGRHGSPRILIPAESPEFRDLLTKRFLGTIRRAEERAKELPNISQGRSSGILYCEPQLEAHRFITNLANFETIPDVNAVCWHASVSRGSKPAFKGFVAAPTAIMYGPLRVAIDEDFLVSVAGIRDCMYFDRKGPKLARILDEQQKLVDKVLGDLNIKLPIK